MLDKLILWTAKLKKVWEFLAFIYFHLLIILFNFYLRWSRSFIELRFKSFICFLITWICLIDFTNSFLFFNYLIFFFTDFLVSFLKWKLGKLLIKLLLSLFVNEKFLNITIIDYAKSCEFFAIHLFYFKSFICQSIKFLHFLFSCLFLESCWSRQIVEKIHSLYHNDDSQKEKKECA